MKTTAKSSSTILEIPQTTANTAVQTSTGTATTSPSSSTTGLVLGTVAASTDDNGGRLSAGATAGIGIAAGVSLLVVVGICGGCYLTRRRRNENLDDDQAVPSPGQQQFTGVKTFDGQQMSGDGTQYGNIAVAHCGSGTLLNSVPKDMLKHFARPSNTEIQATNIRMVSPTYELPSYSASHELPGNHVLWPSSSQQPLSSPAATDFSDPYEIPSPELAYGSVEDTSHQSPPVVRLSATKPQGPLSHSLQDDSGSPDTTHGSMGTTPGRFQERFYGGGDYTMPDPTYMQQRLPRH